MVSLEKPWFHLRRWDYMWAYDALRLSAAVQNCSSAGHLCQNMVQVYMPGRILVPLDESPPARHALEYTLGAYPEAEITAVHVIDFAHYRCGQSHLYYAPELLDPLADVETTVFDPARRLAADHGREITTALKPGPPTDTIVEYAVT